MANEYVDLVFEGKHTGNMMWTVTKPQARALILAWLDPEKWAEAGEEMPHDAEVIVSTLITGRDEYNDQYEWTVTLARYKRGEALDLDWLLADGEAEVSTDELVIRQGTIYRSREHADTCVYCDGSGIVFPDDEDPDQSTFPCYACAGTGKNVYV